MLLQWAGSELAAASSHVKSGLPPTIQPFVSLVMYTEVSIGGIWPSSAGESETCSHDTPSQCNVVVKFFPGKPTAHPSLGAAKNTDFSVALVCPVGVIPPGILGAATGSHLVPSQ